MTTEELVESEIERDRGLEMTEWVGTRLRSKLALYQEPLSLSIADRNKSVYHSIEDKVIARPERHKSILHLLSKI